MKIELSDFPQEYDNLTQNNLCTFYQSTQHLRFLQKILKINVEFVTAVENGKLLGALPLFKKKTKYGIVINSLPFFGSYGGLVADKIDIKKNILNFLNEYNKEQDVLSSVIIANPFDSSEVYEKFFKFDDKDERLIQCIRLEKKQEADLWNNFEQRVRRAIRKAEKNLVSVEVSEPDEELLDDFYKNHVENISSKNGAIKPKEFFSLLEENFTLGDDYNIFTAKYEGKPIAYLLVFHFKSFTEYYMPAYEMEKSDLQGTSLLIWESIKKALSSHKKYYNFGGTHLEQKSLYNFKKGWKTDDFRYNYYISGNLSKIRELGEKILRENFKNFYVYNYSKLSE